MGRPEVVLELTPTKNEYVTHKSATQEVYCAQKRITCMHDTHQGQILQAIAGITQHTKSNSHANIHTQEQERTEKGPTTNAHKCTRRYSYTNTHTKMRACARS